MILEFATRPDDRSGVVLLDMVEAEKRIATLVGACNG